MPPVRDEAVDIQGRYYSETAARYEQMHAHEGSGDAFNQKFIKAVLQMLGAESVLDVGTATAYRLLDLHAVLPNAFLCGIEPVGELLDIARRNGVLSSATLIRGSGLALPFADKSFDVVCEFATLHHVQRPDIVVKEMTRVARKAVLISDSNRFGQGNTLARFLKLAMYKTHTWRFFDWVRTMGKGYRITDGDGLCYSYSIYDSFHQLASWADRLIIIPSDGGKARSWLHPLLNSAGVVVLAVREG